MTQEVLDKARTTASMLGSDNSKTSSLSEPIIGHRVRFVLRWNCG